MESSNSLALNKLRSEVVKFEEWADSLNERKAEWEVFYLSWDDIYDAVRQYISEVPLSEWQPETYDLILYILARDNEDEVILRLLEQHPEQLVALAFKALTFEDFHARWQLAHGLSQVGVSKDVAESLIQKFLADEDEYVRRRASSALEYLGNTKDSK